MMLNFNGYVIFCWNNNMFIVIVIEVNIDLCIFDEGKVKR